MISIGRNPRGSFSMYKAPRTSRYTMLRFCDSNWADDPNDRNSTSGYVLMISNGPICWSVKKKHTISLSSAEVEYRGVVNAATQCVWLQGILRELGVALDSPTVIRCENQSVIKISTNPI